MSKEKNEYSFGSDNNEKAKEISIQVQEILASQEIRKQLAQSLMERFQAHYTARVMARNTANLYREVNGF